MSAAHAQTPTDGGTQAGTSQSNHAQGISPISQGGGSITRGSGRVPRGASFTPTQSMILHMQRTAGNAAVNALLRQITGGRQAQEATAVGTREESRPQAIQRTSPTGSGAPVVQRLMSFNEFEQATGQVQIHSQTHKKSGIKGAFGAKKTTTTTTTDKERMGLLGGGKNESGVRTNINYYYLEYEKNPIVTNLIKVYDEITYWQTVHANRKGVDDLRSVLDTVKKQIETEVQLETAKQSGGEANMPVDQLLKQPSETTKSVEMEPFLKEIGVPAGYYAQHLAGKPERIKALQYFYISLRDGHLYNASWAYKQVSDVEGMYLIKPLFLAHFPHQAHLRNLVGTNANADQGNELTDDERNALGVYISAGYKPINNQLRDHDMRRGRAHRIGTARRTENDSKTADDARNLHSTATLVVSGLKKLPRFQGVAYRVSVNVPPGYFSAVQPGGLMTDLAFQSASPSMTGVGKFAATQSGTKNLYYIIHTKTAVNIAGLNPTEAEILFRPGTRFQVEAVWEHVNGKIPAAAPVQAQMVLHAMGELKSERGQTKGEWEEMKRKKVLLGSPEDQQQFQGREFTDEKLNKVKVLEITEV